MSELLITFLLKEKDKKKRFLLEKSNKNQCLESYYGVFFGERGSKLENI